MLQHDASNDLTFYYGSDGITGFHLKKNVVDSDYYYKKNIQNDIIGIYSTEEKQIARYEYDAWGNCITKYLQDDDSYATIDSGYNGTDTSITNRFIAFINPFRYRSYYYDEETKLYYLNSRYYDPQICRFINADNISTLDVTKIALNGLNLYAYCLNNPVNTSDNNGDIPNWLKWLIGGLVIIVAASLTVITAGGFAAAGTALLGVFTGATIGGAAGFFAAATVGVIIAGAIGIISGGISSVITGGNFWDGAADGFMWGSISGFLGGGFGSMFNGVGTLTSITGKAVGSIPQIIRQSLISLITYMGQEYANGNNPTILGALASLFAGSAGGALAHTIFSTQLTVQILGEGLKITIQIFQKLLSNLLNFNKK